MYVTVAEFRGAGSMSPTAQATTTALPDAQVEDLIEKASRFFDLLCGVEPEYFEPAGATAANRTFYGDGSRFLKLDHYVAGSLNATITFPEGYTAPDFVERDGYLVITSSEGILASPYTWGDCCGWYSGIPIIVSAKWGVEATPADVKLAVIELAINLWRELDPANVKLVNLEGQPLREKAPPRVWETAKRYRVNSGVLV
jgi:hypothetical protein